MYFTAQDGINALTEYFTRNPGLTYPNKTRMDNIAVSFQPEIGSVSSPVVESLRRFMSPAVLDDFPSSLGTPTVNATSHPVWAWHNYEYFISNIADDSSGATIGGAADVDGADGDGATAVAGIDHLERYGVPRGIEEYRALRLRHVLRLVPLNRNVLLEASHHLD